MISSLKATTRILPSKPKSVSDSTVLPYIFNSNFGKSVF